LVFLFVFFSIFALITKLWDMLLSTLPFDVLLAQALYTKQIFCFQTFQYHLSEIIVAFVVSAMPGISGKFGWSNCFMNCLICSSVAWICSLICLS